MKKVLFVLIMAILGFVWSLPGCDVTLEAKEIAGKNPATRSVRVVVEFTHGRCPVKIEETQFKTEGVRIDKRGLWKELPDGLYQIDLQVTLTGKNGKIAVVRECGKCGRRESLLTLSRD